MDARQNTTLNRPFQGTIPKEKIHAIWGSRPPAAIAKGGIVLTIRKMRRGDYRVTIRPTAKYSSYQHRPCRVFS